jgi:hypothetical protein
MLAFGTQVSGFTPGQSRRIFRAKKILSTPSFTRHFSPTVPPSATGCLKRLQCVVENEKIVLLEGWGMAVLNE